MIESVSTPGCAAGAEHFDDDRFARMLVRREADHLDHDFVDRASRLRAWIANGHRLSEDLAIDIDIARSAALFVNTDELVRVALRISTISPACRSKPPLPRARLRLSRTRTTSRSEASIVAPAAM